MNVLLLAMWQVAQTTPTTEEVERVVGEPLPSWIVLAASAALLVAILAAGLLVSRRTKDGGR